MKPLRKIDILDTTLRDGNYAVDFQFTVRDTKIIAFALDGAGFDWIEIGHGLGLNASNSDKGKAAASDREYLQAVKGALRRAKYGMFFIPGIGRPRDIKMACDLGMSFIRVGTNADKVPEAKKYINLAKKMGLTVFSNLMKSYALKPGRLAEAAQMGEDFGADVICIVDSAGGMLPENVEEYFNAARRRVSVRLGFHGHNNLSLALANTLKAIECGATIVDSSLQGLGRSGGNAPTETLIAVLEKKKMLSGIDIRKTMDISEKLVRPFLHTYGIRPIDVTLGYAQFHSSFMAKISASARRYGVDERELVMRVSAKDRLEPSGRLIAREAGKLKEKASLRLPREFVTKTINIHSGGWASERKTTLENAVREIGSNSKRTGKPGVLNIVFPNGRRAGGMRISPFIQEDFSYVIGTAEASGAGHVKKIIKAADGLIDYILFDSTHTAKGQYRLIRTVRKGLKKTRLLLYSDYRAWINTVAREVSALAGGLAGLKIAVFGDAAYTLNTAVALAEMGAFVTLHVDEKDKEALTRQALVPFTREGMRLGLEKNPLKASKKKDILIGFSPGRRVITKNMAGAMSDKGFIIDAGLGSVREDIIPYAHRKGIKVIRVDMRPVIAGEITSSIGVRELLRTHLGKKKVKGKAVVSGGLIGRKGDIVVDSALNPKKVIGIAKGDGTVQYGRLAKHKKDIEKIEKEILTKRALLET